jgi:hypothetical protein
MKVMIYIVVPILILTTHIFHVSGQVTGTSSSDGLSLTLKLREFSTSRLTIDLTLENKASEEIYVALNPRDLVGKLGFYVNADESNPSVLLLSSQVYPMPSSFVYSDETSVELKRLLPSERFSERLVLKAPFKETDPPFGAHLMARKTVFSPEKVNRIIVAFGYFPADGVGNLANRRVKGTAPVRLNDGRRTTLLELQKIATAELVLH